MKNHLTLIVSGLLSFCSFFPAVAQFGEKQVLIGDIPDEKYKASVDLNQDGFQDLIVFRPDKAQVAATDNPSIGGYYVKYNDGTGVFSEGQLIKNDNTDWTAVVPADLDGDGRLDLAIYQDDNDKVVWLQNQGADQEFSWKFNVITEVSGWSLGKSSFIFQDIDGDDDLDFLCDCSNLWYKNNGEGNFTESFVISDESISPLFATDLDEDGMVDVVDFKSGTLMGYEYQDDNSWISQTLTTLDDFDIGGYTYRAQPFDMDNDGDLDIVYHERERFGFGTFRILENTENGYSLIYKYNVYEDGSNFSIIDYDGNGYLDVVSGVKFLGESAEDGYSGSDETVWLKNQGGNWSAETIFENQYALDIGQYNADGHIDFLIWNTQGIFLSLGESEGFKTTQVMNWSSISSLSDIHSADFNGDGQVDFLMTGTLSNDVEFGVGWLSGYEIIAVLLSQPSGDYEIGIVNQTTIIDPEFLDFADLDNDGDLDVVALLIPYSGELIETYEVIWYENDGNGAFTERQSIASTNNNEYDGGYTFSVFDSNNDGYAEVAAFSKVYKNNQGSFTEDNSIPVPQTLADFNGDGAVDIISEGQWYENDGSGNYTPRSEVNGITVDLDGDGDTDVVNGDRWYENDGSGSFTQKSISSEVEIAKLVDIDADGDADGIYSDDGLWWIENQNGQGNFENPRKIDDDLSAYSSHYSDIDNDSDNDIISGYDKLFLLENFAVNEVDTPLSLNLENTEGLPGDTVSAPVKVQSGFEELTALSFSLNWDPELATYAGVNSSESLTLETGATPSGQLGITWENEAGRSKSAGTTFLSLQLVLVGEEEQVVEISFADEPITQAATNSDDRTVPINTENAQVSVLVSQAPTDISLSNREIEENQAAGSLVGTFTTTDPDNSEGFTYTLTEGEGDPGNDLFSISGDELVTNEPFDYEANAEYSIRVTTADSQGKRFTKVFTITVLDLDDTNNPPTDITLSSTQLAENSPAGTVVGDLTAVDADEDDTLTFALVGGGGSNDNDLFAISEAQLIALKPFDFEEKSEYSVRIQVQDGQSGKFSKAFTITIGDVDESSNQAPTDISLDNNSIAENEPANTMVGNFSTTDPDESDTHTYALVAGEGDEGNDLFRIRDNRLRTAVSFDYEGQNEYSIRVVTRDENGGSLEKTFVITVNDRSDDVNQLPTDITLSANTVEENQPIGTLVGELTSTDPDNAIFSYSLVSGNGSEHNAQFTIEGNELRTAASFDYEILNQLSIRIQTDDGRGGTFSKSFTILVNDVEDQVNRRPTNILLSNYIFNEALPAGTVVGTFSTNDPDGEDQHQYRLVYGGVSNDNDLFTIEDDQLFTATNLDPTLKNSYTIRVQTDDGRGGTFEKTLVITAEDPVDVLSVVNPVEDQQLQANEVFSIVIPDSVFAGESLVISADLSDGSPLPEWLSFDAPTLTLSGTPPAGADTVSIRLTATNQQGDSVVDEFILSIEGVTALDEEIHSAIRVYPVPVDQELYIESVSNHTRLRSYRLLDTQGNILQSKEVLRALEASLRLDLSSLAQGMYLLEVIADTKVYQRRILVR